MAKSIVAMATLGTSVKAPASAGFGLTPQGSH
jgi:hypothetical protein